MSKQASSNGRWIDVEPARFPGWVGRFVSAHGSAAVHPLSDGRWRLVAGDATEALFDVPFPPLEPSGLDGADASAHADGAASTAGMDAASWSELVVKHARTTRCFGLLLVRRGGYAVGVAENGRLTQSKIGTRHVQGRTAAGGWSQQRFARRREGQTRELVGAAADVADRLLMPDRSTLTSLVAGGDRAMVRAVLADRRLQPLAPLVVERFLATSDPRLLVLKGAVDSALAIRVQVR